MVDVIAETGSWLDPLSYEIIRGNTIWRFVLMLLYE